MPITEQRVDAWNTLKCAETGYGWQLGGSYIRSYRWDARTAAVVLRPSVRRCERSYSRK